MKLETKGTAMRFGGLAAVSDLNISIEKGEIVGLIGPNGAGKTTAFNMITGVYAPTEVSLRVPRHLERVSRGWTGDLLLAGRGRFLSEES
jgi:ABC-type branched-subunit amino acid transport system ATPase component